MPTRPLHIPKPRSTTNMFPPHPFQRMETPTEDHNIWRDLEAQKDLPTQHRFADQHYHATQHDHETQQPHRTSYSHTYPNSNPNPPPSPKESEIFSTHPLPPPPPSLQTSFTHLPNLAAIELSDLSDLSTQQPIDFSHPTSSSSPSSRNHDPRTARRSGILRVVDQMEKEERRRKRRRGCGGVDRKELWRMGKVWVAVLMLVGLVVGVGVFFWKEVYGKGG